MFYVLTYSAGGAALSSGFQDLCLEGSRDNAPVFHPFFISVIEESDLGVEGDGNQEHIQQLLKEYEHREGVVVEELDHAQDVSSGGEEKYEKSSARHGDAIFSRFMKRISLCPQQILRYHRSGEPLFISEPPSNLIQVVPACSTCGGRRTFELQLMPALVSLLRRVDGGPEEELDFGSVLVFTCTNSCWTEVSEFKEEFCFVQDDPDQQLFK